jgi:predicted nucleotidyltransferase
MGNEMRTADQLRRRREEILRIAAKHGVGNVFVFGSVARGEETADSDIDLLVDVAGEPTPWFPGGLVADLEELLGRRVQVVIRRSLSPLIRESVLKDASPL